MEKVIYNPLKLSEYRALFHNKRVLLIGAGAVGSYLMEYLTKQGVSPDSLDFDFVTHENGAKNSCLIRIPEDAGRNKAECVAERVQPLLDEGCSSNGINADLCKLGPEAFSDYDVVFVAVDNFDAKVLLGELIRQLPKERRPIIIMDGTHDEMAQSVILDNEEFCIRCLIDERWMKDSSIRTSCTGPQIRQINGSPKIVRTSNMASSMAAHLSGEQFRGHTLGYKDVMNCRLTYTAYPHLELSTSYPKRKNNCPGCRVKPPQHMRILTGTVLEKSLQDTLNEIEKDLGTKDFEVSVHRLNYRKVVHGGFVVDDVCRCCGKPIRIMKHEGRLFMNDFICQECAENNVSVDGRVTANHGGEILHAFTQECEEDIKEMTLYDLGYPLGAHIEVVQRNGALDFLDDEKIITTVYFCEDDHLQMHVIKQL